MKTLVLFDLDNTLLTGDSDFEWAQFLIDKGVLDRKNYEAANQEFYDAYRAGTLDIHAFLAFQLQPLARYERVQLDAWHREFMTQRIAPIMTAAGRELVAQWQSKDAVCAIVTATNSFVTAPIAAAFGVTHLIATEPERINGVYTGGITGIPCFREGKVTRLTEWLMLRGEQWHDFERSYFYSDSLNDLPLLERVSDPIAVDPDATLRREAEARGWPIISLRN